MVLHVFWKIGAISVTNFRIRVKGREGERRRKTRMDSKATENRT